MSCLILPSLVVDDCRDSATWHFDTSDSFMVLRSNGNRVISGASTSPGLDWHHVAFSVRVRNGKKTSEKVILDDVNGFAHRGEVTGIIGPSGSGKTTLLNILTGRVAGKCKIDGKILFDGKKRDKSTWKWTVGYVEQFDLMYDSLTCWETLAFSAMTRLPRSYSAAQKLERAQAVLQTLNLDKVRDTRVGSGAKRGASGGERKRVAVGCELVTSPSLLCLDECTFIFSNFSTTPKQLLTTCRYVGARLALCLFRHIYPAAYLSSQRRGPLHHSPTLF